MNKNSTTFSYIKTQLIHSIFQILDRTLSLFKWSHRPTVLSFKDGNLIGKIKLFFTVLLGCVYLLVSAVF